jgi:hypothetical protein
LRWSKHHDAGLQKGPGFGRGVVYTMCVRSLGRNGPRPGRPDTPPRSARSRWSRSFELIGDLVDPRFGTCLVLFAARGAGDSDCSNDFVTGFDRQSAR